jgi:hypothetical protein
MSAMNRKMFVNRDARNKLAGMGGILSSSSELMGATQRFEPGGVVNAGEGLTPIATVGNRSFFLTQDGRSIVDGEGRTVRDPSVLRAIMQQDQGARNTGTPQISNDPELVSSQLLGNQRSSFAAPAGETTPVSSLRPAMPGQMDVSTGVPMTMEGVQSSTLRERMQAAEDGLGVPPQQEDRFPQEDQRLAEQEAQLANISNTQLSAQERMQMTMPEPTVSNSDQTRVLDMAEAGASSLPETVVLNEGTLGAASFEFDPATGQVLPIGSAAEIMFATSEANVQEQVIDQFDFDRNIQPQMLANQEAEKDQFAFENSGEDGDLLEAAANSAVAARTLTPTDLPSEVDKVLSRTQPFVRPTSLLDEIAAETDLSTPEVAAAALQDQVIEADAATDAPEVDPPSTGINTTELSYNIDMDPANAGFTASTAILDSAGVDTSDMGIEERTVAMRDMLDGLMGQTDAQEKEEFWMNMAMVGFGIAAGESSSAMKNIADGLLAGTAQISKGNAAKSERNDRFTLTAFGEVLADQRAQEKFARDQTLAEIRAGGSGSIYGTRKDPLSQMYQLADTLWAGGAGNYDTYLEAKGAARIQIEQDYGITLPRGAGGGGSGGGEDMVTIEQGGQRIQIPRSQLPGN